MSRAAKKQDEDNRISEYQKATFNKQEELLKEVLLPMKDGQIQSTGAYYKVDVIAALFNLTVRRIQQLTQEGILPTVETSGGRRYELVPTIQRYVEYLSNKAYGKNKSEKEAELKQQKLEAEIELKSLQGDFHKIKNDIAAGKLVSVEDVKKDYRRFFTIFKKFALRIPNIISVKISGECNPTEVKRIEKDLNHDIITLLNNFIVAGEKEEIDDANEKAAVAKNKKV